MIMLFLRLDPVLHLAWWRFATLSGVSTPFPRFYIFLQQVIFSYCILLLIVFCILHLEAFSTLFLGVQLRSQRLAKALLLHCKCWLCISKMFVTYHESSSHGFCQMHNLKPSICVTWGAKVAMHGSSNHPRKCCPVPHVGVAKLIQGCCVSVSELLQVAASAAQHQSL